MKFKNTETLTLVSNSGGRTEETRKRKIIETSNFKNEIGAYVIRYKSHKIPRFSGYSSILKIGCTTDGFQNRFKNYNHQSDMTVVGTDLLECLKVRSQKTNVRLMHFLAHVDHPDEIVIDFYSSDEEHSPEELEYALIKDYFLAHNELPPLNFGMK
ncbi:hypothetical protein [Photobacterium marinum]|uniref:hypothetical protein n=1 Tax=Photobacterium marinum TaxID=1056511 RepID=UPI000569F847|nr:hypothetical protein [Photobacterium marinum]